MTALDNIKAALEAGPTEGPWFVAPNGQYKIATITKVTGIFSDKMPTEAAIRADAALIAACNPSAIRELLAYVESLEKDAGRWRTAIAMPWVLTADSQDYYHWGISIARVHGAEAVGDPEAIIDAAMEQTK